MPFKFKLYRYAKAYSIYDRTVGYVQGMGFVAVGLCTLNQVDP